MQQRRQSRQRGGGFREQKEFEQRIIDLARVTRVVAGGKRMRFRACVALGDRKGRLGIGVAKGNDVTAAIAKATTQAEKNMIAVSIVRETIPYAIHQKFSAARILLKPAPPGTGIKAGGVMRILIDLAGIPNIVGKMLGSNNKLNNAQAMIEALRQFQKTV